MKTFIKQMTCWIVSTFAVFGIMYLLGSFCTLSLDISSWTNLAGRCLLAFIACGVGILFCCCISDAERWEAMSREEREKAMAAREVNNRTHADY